MKDVTDVRQFKTVVIVLLCLIASGCYARPEPHPGKASADTRADFIEEDNGIYNYINGDMVEAKSSLWSETVVSCWIPDKTRVRILGVYEKKRRLVDTDVWWYVLYLEGKCSGWVTSDEISSHPENWKDTKESRKESGKKTKIPVFLDPGTTSKEPTCPPSPFPKPE